MNQDQNNKLQQTYDDLDTLELKIGRNDETHKMRQHLDSLGFLETEAIIGQILEAVNERIEELLKAHADTDPSQLI